jgi:hypothetical protein
VPDSLFTYDIPSIVHVLDLGVVLPLLVLSGVMLLRGHPMGPVLAAMLLVKTVTLGLALLSMNAFVAASGGEIDPAEPVIWAAVVLVSGAWLVVGARRLRPWTHRGCARPCGDRRLVRWRWARVGGRHALGGGHASRGGHASGGGQRSRSRLARWSSRRPRAATTT